MIETRGPVFFVVMTTLAACAAPELPEVAPPSDSPEVTVEETRRGAAPQSSQGASSALAQEATGADTFGYRAAFTQIVRLAESAAALPALADGQ